MTILFRMFLTMKTSLMRKCDFQTTADGLLPDKAHRQWQGILYFQNVIHFHGT